jgi:hypothetical protein
VSRLSSCVVRGRGTWSWLILPLGHTKEDRGVAGVKAGVTGAVLDVKVKSGFGASSSDPPHRSVMARVL